MSQVKVTGQSFEICIKVLKGDGSTEPDATKAHRLRRNMTSGFTSATQSSFPPPFNPLSPLQPQPSLLLSAASWGIKSSALRGLHYNSRISSHSILVLPRYRSRIGNGNYGMMVLFVDVFACAPQSIPIISPAISLHHSVLNNQCGSMTFALSYEKITLTSSSKQIITWPESLVTVNDRCQEHTDRWEQECGRMSGM